MKILIIVSLLEVSNTHTSSTCPQPIPSQEWNGVPRGYKIKYRMWSTEAEDEGIESVQESTWTTVQLENGINIDSYILVHLQEWMDYQIRMISYNDVGTSPYSPVTTARTRESSEHLLQCARVFVKHLCLA